MAFTKIELLVVANADGTVEVFAPGQLPAGAGIENPKKITVTGPYWIIPPSGKLTQQELQNWQSDLQAKGFSFS